MAAKSKQELEKEVVINGRENGISYTLFRNAIGKKLSLNITDFECLDLIFFRGASTPTELSRYTGVSSGSTTIIIDRLEKAGLVRRIANPNDRRGTLVTINPGGAKRVAPLFASVRKSQEKLLSGYSSQELLIIADYLKSFAAMYEAERHKLPTA